MDKKELSNNIEEHWERMKEDILSNVSQKDAFKIDLLVDSIENNLSVIKSILDCKDEVDDENLKEVDVYRGLKIVKYLLKFLDECKDNEEAFYNGKLIASYGTDCEDFKTEKYIIEYFKNRGIDITIESPSSLCRTVCFKHSNIEEIRRTLTGIPINLLDIKWYDRCNKEKEK